jgi:pimeloyl-ACP methyl ester carboxylesterase
VKAATRENVTNEFRLAGSNGRPIRGQALEPESARATVVLVHGFKGFSRWGFWPYLSQALARARFRAVSFDLSGSGIGPDRESFTDLEGFEQNTYTRELADIDTVIAECERRRWIPNGYGLLGHSRGGGMAILHADRNPRVRALATWAAISKIRTIDPAAIPEWRRRGFLEVPNTRTGQVLRLGTAVLDECDRLEGSTLDIGAAAERLRIPWLIVHGTDDETVPMAAAETLHRRSTSGVANLMIVHGANHVFQATHPFGSPAPQLRDVVERTVGFFDRNLG